MGSNVMRPPTEAELIVAESLWRDEWGGVSGSATWYDVDVVRKERYLRQARTALGALRKPTTLMVLMARRDDLAYDGDPGAVWRAMVDAASPPAGAP